jgi:hypothetical protein
VWRRIHKQIFPDFSNIFSPIFFNVIPMQLFRGDVRLNPQAVWTLEARGRAPEADQEILEAHDAKQWPWKSLAVCFGICYNYIYIVYIILWLYMGVSMGFLKGGSPSHHVFQYWNGRFFVWFGGPKKNLGKLHLNVYKMYISLYTQ